MAKRIILADRSRCNAIIGKLDLRIDELLQNPPLKILVCFL
jgi:hypothetical protein